MIVAGADGCPAGWVLVLWQGPEGPPPQARLMKKLSEVLTWDERPAFLAVDMPIGLPEKAERGGRLCEREARARLGQRQSSVFSTPARAALAAEEFQEACRLNRAHSDPPRGVSKQCFNIFPKIRELAAIATPETTKLATRLPPGAGVLGNERGDTAALAEKSQKRAGGTRPHAPPRPA